MQVFIETVNIFKPKVFLFENLPTFFKSFPQDDFLKEFPGYSFKIHIGSVSLWGNSQISRERLVVIGIRRSHKGLASYFEKLPKRDKIRLKKAGELAADLKYPNPDLLHLREADTTVVCMEKDFKKLNLAQIREIWNSKEYATRKKWDATTTGKGKMKNLPGVYRNLANEYPLTARKQNRQFNPQGDIMSPRELARIQGLPDDFRLYLDPKNTQYWINKGRVTATKCPPYEIGAWFAKKLFKVKTQLKKK
jgi:site-specific DNA-cytosine methylase